MADSEFPEDYDLTVFLFSRDVFCYVSSATVDLLIFGSDQATLIESLRSAHRSIRFRPLPQERKALIEGPFSAVRALRHDLIRRAGRLKSSKLRGTPPNPRVISPPVSHGLSKAEREPLGSSGLSPPPPQQSTGEASEVQSRRSKAKAQTAPRRQKVLDESVARGGSYENGAVPRVEMFSEYTREQMKASGVDAGIISSLSGLETSAMKPEEEAVSQNHTSSRYDFLENLSSSSVNRLKNTSTSIQDDPKDVEDIWVDSCTFRYLQTFHKTQLDGCLKNAYVVEGRDLTRIALTGSQTSRSASRLRESLENLKDLMDSWQSKLRVHEVPYSKAEFPDERELARICDSLHHKDVLYTFEDSCIRVVGPSWSSHLFCEMVKIKIRILKGMVVKP
ncbi:uncharacterized protein LOC125001174 isoform X2 [Mugil cephalus]|nr:uncharacterized protein LOC125001174 isoform X2 [Mugil cephalus]